MFDDVLAIARNTARLMVQGWWRTTLPTALLVLTAMQLPVPVYQITAEHLPFAARLGVAAWSGAMALAAAMAVATLLVALQCGLGWREVPRAVLRLVRIWLTQCLWLVAPALLLSGVLGFAVVADQSLAAWVDGYVAERLAAGWQHWLHWQQPPHLELVAAIALYGLAAAIAANWLWPPLALLRLDDQVAATRRQARRMLQRIPHLEWVLLVGMVAAIVVALWVAPAVWGVLVMLIAWPALVVAALQRSRDAYWRGFSR
ncbi:hypothetical protein CKO15_11420 [Halorhodospira abdelmalekii]|uniref:hypothetical protein n=1 Tax=Halorhodospira abdelmalekii TaxID=421629 RepID=UPI001903225A|nr:hypothetical protein [Halorhodospira abdelmalekii]MBK1735876.1 hypothetical protein [Halorhodospira abdelmalekii]